MCMIYCHLWEMLRNGHDLFLNIVIFASADKSFFLQGAGLSDSRNHGCDRHIENLQTTGCIACLCALVLVSVTFSSCKTALIPILYYGIIEDKKVTLKKIRIHSNTEMWGCRLERPSFWSADTSVWPGCGFSGPLPTLAELRPLLARQLGPNAWLAD